MHNLYKIFTHEEETMKEGLQEVQIWCRDDDDVIITTEGATPTDQAHNREANQANTIELILLTLTYTCLHFVAGHYL